MSRENSANMKQWVCYPASILFIVLLVPAARTDGNVSGAVPGHCRRAATCIPVDDNLHCGSQSLSHAYTTFDLVRTSDDENLTTDIVLDKLQQWKGLHQVPRCWEAIVPLLCALYTPSCLDGLVELPGKDMCERTRRPCRIVEIERGWPDFMNCSNPAIYKTGCTEHNVFQDAEVNSPGECQYPLVATDNELSWYEHAEGCGIQCEDVFFTEEEHSKMHRFIAVLASLCLILTFFTLATFIADWKNSSRYPAVILFYMNGCFFMASIGFLAQFPPNAREDIVCRTDETMRIGEPSEDVGYSCVTIFVIVYYFIMAGVFWFVILSYAWHISFRALGTPVDALQGKTGYFHIVSWVFPFIFIVIILACNQVDGDSMMGICFVGRVNHTYRTIFVLIPTGLAIGISAFFLTNGMITLCHVDRDNPGLLSDKASTRIKGTIARIGVFATLNFIYVLITLACHFYTYTNQERWEVSMRDYLSCRAEVRINLDIDDDDDEIEECTLKSKPNLAILMIHIFSFFGAGITMSTWVWTPSSLAIWKRAWRKISRQPINEPLKLRKSRMIAKAFARKQDHPKADKDDDDDKLSLSFESASHDDAIGMKLDIPVSSMAHSSSTWGGNVPTRMLNRRGAAMPVATISNSSSPAPQTPDSAIDVGPPDANVVRTRAVIEPIPANVLQRLSAKKKRKKRSRRQKLAPRLQGPSRMETPMPEEFSDDGENYIHLDDKAETFAGPRGTSTNAGSSGSPRSRDTGSSGIGTLNESGLGGTLMDSKMPSTDHLEGVTFGSKVPKLPAIVPKKAIHRPVRFELPGVSAVDEFL
nr:smoothened precursor [Eupentacta fraudatrix]